MKMSRVDINGREVCSICGASAEWYDTKEHRDPSDMKDNTKHSPWCKTMGESIYDMFEGTFARTYNIIELALDDNRAKKANGLIGGIISETRERVISTIRDYMNNTKE